MLEDSDVSALSLMFGLLFIVIPVLALAGAAVFVYLNQKRVMQKAPAPRDFRAVTAHITAATVEEAARSRVEDNVLYYPSIQFEYTDGERVYKCTQAVGRPHNVISRAWQTLSRYEVGKEITVYCNPERPGEARLWLK
ncbi:MAG: DUF3592 domain-containing protein [Syntrophorhabdaceae bacterium]|nr:DUF3592 domain-containing protein [Syntrophorhabdaceae bacterium]MDD4196708.1 DUF3592 domain-containing protein [Syntrophorhabdaceae bacterium]HOC45762.1 DUF3592 domain-containing protein [Syntrophorhabdaceae bacterium]